MGLVDDNQLLLGDFDFDSLPARNSRSIKLFLCCNRSESVQERDVLVKEVYPKLREYCRQRHGVEFHAIDLHWGVEEQQWPDHSYTQFVSSEIKRCQQLSAGPNFLAFLGQRYGQRLLPATILEEDFARLRSALSRHRGREVREARLLDTWYRRDGNAVPTEMVLQPITTHIKAWNDENCDAREEARGVWQETEVTLRQLLQLGVKLCLQDGSMDGPTALKYTASQLEAEVLSGLNPTCCKKEGPRALAMQRTISDLHNYISHPAALNFIEVVYNAKEETFEVDEDSSARLASLINDHVIRPLDDQEFHRTSVLWRFDTGINPSLDIHRKYLEELGQRSRVCLERLVEAHARSYREEAKPEVVEEVTRHWQLVIESVEGFWGQEEALDTIRSYLVSTSDQPLVLHGVSGSGKTATIAKAATLVKQWFNHNDVMVVCRFFGLTPNSSDIRQAIFDICCQLAQVSDQDISRIPNDYLELLKYFHATLAAYPENKNLVILLDALDQLTPDHNAYYMNWLPKQLTENVKFVVAARPDRHKILQRLRTELVCNKDNFLELENLGPDAARELLTSWLSDAGRVLTGPQHEYLASVFSQCSLPMYVKLRYQDACQWTSYFMPSQEDVAVQDLPSYIHEYFGRLEREHGRPLVSRTLSYITASATGLSDLELEDLLSLDDVVLDIIFTDYHPAVRRLPPLYLSRLLHRLLPFLSLREADGVTVYTWSHALFADITEMRYLAEDAVKKNLHNCLSDYFLGHWAYKPKPFVYSEAMAKQLKIVDPAARQAADRLVPPQPLTFETDTGEVRFNKRKYDQVPRQLYLAGRLDELNKLVTFNYDWFYNKTKAMSLQHILNDIAINKTEDAQLIVSALRAAQPVMARNVNNMAAEISGRLLPYYVSRPAIRELINMCDSHGLTQSCFVPAYPYYQVPGGPLQYTLECPSKIDCFGFTNDYRNLLAKTRDSSTVQVLDLATGELKDPIEVSCGDMYVTPDGNHVILVEHLSQRAVKVHRVTGQYVGQLIPMNHVDLPNKDKYRLSNIDVTDQVMCMVVTTEKSYVFLADIATCKFFHIIPLDFRATVCRISPDQKHVFCNSGDTLYAYNIDALRESSKTAPVSSTPLGHRPTQIAFSKDGGRAFVINNAEPKVMVLHIKDGHIDLSYKIVLEDFFQSDPIKDVKISRNQDRLLLRGDVNLAVYDFMTQQVVCHLSRPVDMPPQFRLPNDTYHDIVFTQADFTRDDQSLLFSIFRNVYIWQLSSSKILTSLQAPIGIIDQMFVSTSRNQIITHLKGSPCVHTWNMDSLTTVGLLDRFTGPVKEIQMTYSDFAAFVRCEKSDEIGAIDMRSGQMVELLTHESPVERFAVTPDGAFVFVACTPTSPLNGANKIWQLIDRKVVYEFGEVIGYPVALHMSNVIFNVCQTDPHFRAPYYITQFTIKDENVEQTVFAHTINYVSKAPFVTDDDKFLVIMAAEDYVEDKLHPVRPYICAFELAENILVKTFGASELSHMVSGKRILDVRQCPGSPSSVIVLYTLVESPDDGVVSPTAHARDHKVSFSEEPMDRDYDATPEGLRMTSPDDSSPRFDDPIPPSDYVGMLVINLIDFSVTHVCDSFLSPSVAIDETLLFSRDMRHCLDGSSFIYDVETGQRMRQLHPAGAAPRRLALGGRLALFAEGDEVVAMSVEDGSELGRCCVHGQVCHLEVGHDDRTILVGTTDGKVVSYSVVDAAHDDTTAAVSCILSRQLDNPPPDAAGGEGRTSRSWDRVASGDTSSYRRDSAFAGSGAPEKTKLRHVKPVPRFRPKSDTMLYVSSASKSCSIM